MAKKKEPKKIKGVTLHKSGKWMWRFQFDGKSYCGYGDTQRQAAEALEKARYEAKNGSYLQPDRLSLDDFFVTWHETYIQPAKKIKTAETYKRLYDLHISPDFGKMRVQNINGIALQRWLNKIAKEYSAQTVKLTRTIFDMILAQAVKNDVIAFNPMEKTTLPALKVAEKKEALTAEHERLFFNYCKGHRYEVLFRLAALTGCRVGELTALTWNDIDLAEGFVSISKTLCKSDENGFMFNSPKSRSSIRTIPLTPEGIKLLQDYKISEYSDRLRNGTRKERDDMRFLLFHTGTLAPLASTAVNNELKKVAAKMRKDGIDIPANFTMHSLRHSFATRAVENGMDIKTLSSLLGHSSITITGDRYVSSFEHVQREEMEKIAAFL